MHHVLASCLQTAGYLLPVYPQMPVLNVPSGAFHQQHKGGEPRPVTLIFVGPLLRGLPRIVLLGGWVNKGKMKGRDCYTPTPFPRAFRYS